MRNKYSKEFEKEMRKKAPSKTIQQLLKIANDKYCYPITKNSLMQYLSKRKIRYKDYNPKKARAMGLKIPVGAEYIKPDGMILVKIAPNKWEYKQRLIYKQYYNVELNDNDYIIFLDHNRSNFDINNLKLISRLESSILSNQQLFSTDPFVTETGIQIVKLINKLKEIKGETKNESCNERL